MKREGGGRTMRNVKDAPRFGPVLCAWPDMPGV